MSALLLLSLMVGCGGAVTTSVDTGSRDGGPGDDGAAPPDAGPLDGAAPVDAGEHDAAPSTIPTVILVAPLSGADAVPVNTSVTATFSEAMDAATLTATTFTLTHGDPAVLVPGRVIYARGSAVFWPAARLADDTTYRATITTGAHSAYAVPLAEDYAWTFTTSNVVAPGLPVDLGTAGNFVMISKAGISTVPTSAITGDIGVSPAAATYITGFSLVLDETTVFATSAQVTGRIYAADYTPPSPSIMTTAVGDMEIAFTDAASRAPDVTELGAGNIGGMTLARGVYAWGTGLLIPTDVHLTGTATDVWIFQIAGDLTVNSGARIILDGGALPQNVFWQVAGFAELDTTAHLEGIVLSQTSITLLTGATVNGRLLAQTAIDIDGSTVVQPAD